MRTPALLATLLLAAPPLSGPASAQAIPGRQPDAVPALAESIYQKGLTYLAGSQNARGCWDDGMGSEPGVAGLCITAFLASGEDPVRGKFADNIRKSIRYIIESQNKSNGYIGNSMYNHAFATLALAEAYGMMEDPAIAPALKQAVDLILSAQKRNRQGGWRYTPDSRDSDTTVTGCQLVALFAARNAGIPVPQENLAKALAYLNVNRSGNGSYGYTSSLGGKPTLTAIGVLCFALAKEREGKGFQASVQYLRENLDFRDRHYPYYFEYYMAQALFHADENLWNDWNQRNLRYLGTIQSPDGSFPGGHGQAFSTAGALLSIALNFRFLPIYEK